MNEHLNPDSVYPPLGAYTQTIRVPRDAEWLGIAGQVGMTRQGRLAAGIEKQAEQAFRNVLACLRANKMGKQDLVKFTVYLTDSRHVAGYRAARKKVIGDEVLPTSTLVIVDGLASPDMLIEVEAWAAKA